MITKIKQIEVRAGDFLRVHLFPVRNYHHGRRTKRFKTSSAAQQKYNQKRRALWLADIMHTNFTDNDYALRLSYDGESPDGETGQKCLALWIRRMRRAYESHGVPFKYIYVTEQGKNNGRVHHHVIINACTGITDNQRELRRIWNNGGLPGKSYVYIAPLEFETDEAGVDEECGLIGLAKYLIFDKAKVSKQQYGRSRNLEEPIISESVGAVTSHTANIIAETGDISEIGALYPEYDITETNIEVFDGEPETPPVSGVFVTIFMRRKEMRFNCEGKRGKLQRRRSGNEAGKNTAGMTKQRLEDFRHLRGWINETDKRIEEAKAVEDTETVERLKRCRAEKQNEYNSVRRWLESVSDLYIRRMLELRYIDGLKYGEIALRMGSGITEDAVRMACKRYIEKSDKIR